MNVYPHERLGALLKGRMDEATPETKHLALTQLGREIVSELLEEHFRNGWTTSPLFALLLRERLTLRASETSVDILLRLHAALERDITRLVLAHHAWRHQHAGNVVWEFTGPTGSGKSSAMLGLLERLNRVDPAALPRHLTVDVASLPHLLPHLANGSGLVVDEQTSLIGEGSVSQEKTLRNIEDQIRASGIDLYWASPTKEDREARHATSQGEFEAILTNHEAKATRFLVWLQGFPLGYCDLPWASPAMWEAYGPLKAANVERALRAKFQAPGALDEEIRRLFDMEAVQKWASRRRLKVQDWRRVIKRHAHALNTSQVQSMAEEIVAMLETLALGERDFFELYGWQATPAMKRCINPEDSE